MQQNNITTTPKAPAGVMTSMTLNRLGVIVSNLSILATCLFPICFFTFLIPAFYYIMLFLMTIFTLGLVFLLIPNFGSWWTAGSGFFNNLINFSGDLLPVLIGISLGGAVLSIILLLFNKNDRQWGRITISIALCAIAIAILVGIVIGGTK